MMSCSFGFCSGTELSKGKTTLLHQGIINDACGWFHFVSIKGEITIALKPAMILGIVMDVLHASAKSAEKVNRVAIFP